MWPGMVCGGGREVFANALEEKGQCSVMPGSPV